MNYRYLSITPKTEYPSERHLQRVEFVPEFVLTGAVVSLVCVKASVVGRAFSVVGLPVVFHRIKVTHVWSTPF